MKRIAVSSATAVAVVLLTWTRIWGREHLKRQWEIKARLEEAIGRDAGYTETILKMEKDSHHITYGEFFELCDKSVNERTNLVVELRGLYPSISNTMKDRLIDFLNAENDAIRSKRELYRKEMLFSTAMEGLTDAYKDRPTSDYGWDFHRERIGRAKQEMTDAAKEVQTSAESFVDAYQKTMKLESEMSDAAADSGIRFKSTFREYDQSNEKKGRESVEVASQVLKEST